MNPDPAALLAEIAELKARIQDMAREHLAVEGQLDERVADLEGRLSRCVELPDIPVGHSLRIDNYNYATGFGFRATIRDSNDKMVHSSCVLGPTPAAALAALTEKINAAR